MVKVQYKNTRINGSRTRNTFIQQERPTGMKTGASPQDLPFGKNQILTQALSKMQSEMQAMGFAKNFELK